MIDAEQLYWGSDESPNPAPQSSVYDVFASAADALDPDYVAPDGIPDFVKKYKYDPRAFMLECFDWPEPEKEFPTPYQLDIADKVIEHHRISVRGPHGLGKTAFAAWLVIWFALTREASQTNWKSIQTASVWRQMTQFLWPEIERWARRIKWEYINSLMPEERRFIPFRKQRELLGTSLNLNFGSAFAVVSTDHEKIEGAHAKSILFVYDESKAIPPKTWDASEGAFSNAGNDTNDEAYLFSISTPGAPAGRFFDIQTRKAGYADWYVRIVSLQEAIDAKRISADWAENRRLQWGENSAMYQNRVLGNFSVDQSTGVVPLTWLEAANQRWLELEETGHLTDTPLTRISSDIARAGDDDTVYAKRHGKVTLPLEKVPGEKKADTMYVTGILQGIVAGVGGECESVIDINGLGAGVFDRLREQGADCWGFVAQAHSDLTDVSGELGFTNKRAEAWWGLRELLNPQYKYNIAIPPDDRLTGELTSPTWRITSGGKIQIESKEEVKKRLGFSTDYADTVVMLYATRPEEEQEGILHYEDRVHISVL